MAADYTEPSPETSIEDRLEATREESDDVVEQHIEVPIDPEDER